MAAAPRASSKLPHRSSVRNRVLGPSRVLEGTAFVVAAALAFSAVACGAEGEGNDTAGSAGFGATAGALGGGVSAGAGESTAGAGPAGASAGGSSAGAGGVNAGAGGTHVGAAGGPGTRPGCTPPGGAAAPRSIAEAVALINALPKPLTLPCFIEALPRPLQLYATRSIFSGQPAAGTRSPRLFLFFDPLILSVVPAGPGTHLLEFGELQSETRSVKGEIEFPILAELPPQAPFEKILYRDLGTTCAVCHGEEEPVTLGGLQAFASEAFRPLASDRVATEYVRHEFSTCDAAVEPDRCAMLNALFGHGEVLHREFPAAMGTIL